MANDFRKVRPGQPVRIPARAWNRLIDEVVPHPRFTGDTADGQSVNFRVLVKNQSGGDVPRWGILAITGVSPAPSGATGAGNQAFESWPTVVGVTPTDETKSRFVVAVEPIKSGAIGMAAIDGVVQVKLDVQSADHRFASPKASTSELRTASSGDAAVLWAEGTGTGKWGLVRIGAGAAGGVRLGKITGTISKGGTGTVYEYDGGGAQKSVPTGTSGATAPSTFTAVNRFATVSASGSAAKWVACGLVDSTWHLIAAEC